MSDTHDSSETEIERRLAAVERAVTDEVLAASDTATTDDRTPSERLDAADDRIDALERRVRELEAATEAVRGYVGAVRAVNQRVERRADAALAAVATLDPNEHSDTDPSAVLAPDDRDVTGDSENGDVTGDSENHGATDDAEETVTAWWTETAPTDCPRLREQEP